jgi:hypothetical protein
MNQLLDIMPHSGQTPEEWNSIDRNSRGTSGAQFIHDLLAFAFSRNPVGPRSILQEPPWDLKLVPFEV